MITWQPIKPEISIPSSDTGDKDKHWTNTQAALILKVSEYVTWCHPYCVNDFQNNISTNMNNDMGQVTELRLSYYLVLLSVDSKTRQQDSCSSMTWPIFSSQLKWFVRYFHEWCMYDRCLGDPDYWHHLQNGHQFPDDNFKCIFLNENIWISTKILLKFVPKGPITNIPSLVQMMAWHWPGDKPLSEPIMVRLPTHICVTRPQWVKMFELKYIRLENNQEIFYKCIMIYVHRLSSFSYSDEKCGNVTLVGSIYEGRLRYDDKSYTNRKGWLWKKVNNNYIFRLLIPRLVTENIHGINISQIMTVKSHLFVGAT